METNKPIQFNGTAMQYLILSVIGVICVYIPFFGWAFLLNYASEWIADNTLVNGKRIRFSAGYGESLKFIFVQTLILLITFGIYIFWFTPKMYRYITDHMSYADESSPVPASAASIAMPVDPTAPGGPAS